MNVNTIFKLLPAVVLSVITMESCQNMDKNENTKEEKRHRNNYGTQKCPLLYIPPRGKEKVDIMLKAAMAAPSAVNKQPWAFIVIDDRDVLNKLAEVLPYAKMTAEAPMAIVVCGDLAKSLNGEFGKYWMLDCSAASENLLLAAEALELGAVWTAIYPEEQRIENVRKVLSLPEHIVPFNLIPIGYPQRNEEAKDKFKQENIHYNQW